MLEKVAIFPFLAYFFNRSLLLHFDGISQPLRFTLYVELGNILSSEKIDDKNG